MQTAYSVSRARAKLPRLLKEAQDQVVGILRNDQVVAYIVSREKWDSFLETLEILSNPKAMKAIRDAKAGRTKYRPLPKAWDED